MIIKSKKEEVHDQHLARIFSKSSIIQYEAQSRKVHLYSEFRQVLDFYLMERGIETNPDKCEVVIRMLTPTTKKEVMKLNRMLTALNGPMSVSKRSRSLKMALSIHPCYLGLQRENLCTFI